MADNKELTIKIKGDSKSAVEALNGVEKSTKSLQGTLQDISKKAAIGFAGLAAGIGFSVKAFADFDNEMRGVKTLLDETSFGSKGVEEGFAKMTEEIKTLGTEVPVNLGAARKALFDIVSAGIPAGEAVAALEVAGKLAVAGLTDVSTATDGLTSALNAYGLGADQAESVASKFFTAQKKGKTTIAELSRGFGQVASTAKSMNVSLDEVLASVAAVTTSGKQTSVAFTGLKAVFANIAKPTADASMEAERLGIQFDAAALRSKGLKGFLDQLTQSADFNKDSVTKLFGSVEAMDLIFALTGQSAKTFEDTLKDLGNTVEAAKVFNQAYETQSKSLSNQMVVLGNTFSTLLVAIGKQFAPVIEEATGLLVGLIKIVQENEALVKWGSAAAGIALALTGLVAALGFLAPAIAAGVSALGALGVSLTVLTGPIGIIIAAIAGLTIAWKTDFLGIQKITIAVGKKLKELFIKIARTTTAILSGGLTEILGVWDDSFEEIEDKTKDSSEAISETLKTAGEDRTDEQKINNDLMLKQNAEAQDATLLKIEETNTAIKSDTAITQDAIKVKTTTTNDAIKSSTDITQDGIKLKVKDTNLSVKDNSALTQDAVLAKTTETNIKLETETEIAQDNIKKKIVDTNTEIVGDTVIKYTALSTTITGRTEEARVDVEDKFSSITEEITAQNELVKKSVSETYSQLLDDTRTLSRKIQIATSNMFKNTVSLLERTASAINITISDTFQSLWDHVAGPTGVLPAITEAVNAFADTITSGKSSISVLAGEIRGILIEAFDGIPRLAATSLNGIVDTVDDLLRGDNGLLDVVDASFDSISLSTQILMDNLADLTREFIAAKNALGAKQIEVAAEDLDDDSLDDDVEPGTSSDVQSGVSDDIESGDSIAKRIRIPRFGAAANAVAQRVIIELRGDAFDLFEAKLRERDQIGISAQ